MPENLKDFTAVKDAITTEIIIGHGWDVSMRSDDSIHVEIANKIVAFGDQPELITEIDMIDLEIMCDRKFENSHAW